MRLILKLNSETSAEVLINPLDIWCLAFFPINISELNKLTQLYPSQEDAHMLYTGFLEGFRLNYCGHISRTDSKKSKVSYSKSRDRLGKGHE